MQNSAIFAKLAKAESKRPLYDIGKWGYPRAEIEALSGVALVWRDGPNGSRGATVPGEHMRVEWAITARAKEICRRYSRFARHMRETRHGWTEVPGGRTYWADNSVEIMERSQLTGETRKREIVAPHGDACF